jgi:hypothetical protein
MATIAHTLDIDVSPQIHPETSLPLRLELRSRGMPASKRSPDERSDIRVVRQALTRSRWAWRLVGGDGQPDQGAASRIRVPGHKIATCICMFFRLLEIPGTSGRSFSNPLAVVSYLNARLDR